MPIVTVAKENPQADCGWEHRAGARGRLGSGLHPATHSALCAGAAHDPSPVLGAPDITMLSTPITFCSPKYLIDIGQGYIS